MGNKGLFHVVAVPRAFFGTFFRAERKYYPLRGGSPSIRAVVGASSPHQGKGAAPAAHWGLSVRSRAGVGASIPAKEFPYSIAIVYSSLQLTSLGATDRQISKRRPPASFPKIYRFELLLLNWAIIRNFFSLALI